MIRARKPSEAASPATTADAVRRQHDADTRLRARALGLLFIAGATIGLTSLLLPHPSSADAAGLYSNIALAYLGAGVLLLFPGQVRRWMLHVALVSGVVLITRAVFLSGESVSFYAVWFLWVPLYAFYFFDRAAAAGYVALCAGLYALTLAHKVPTWAVARWLTTIATLIVAGIFIDTLVRRSRREAANADENAERMAKVADVAVQLASVSDPVIARVALCHAASQLTGAVGVALWEPREDDPELRLSAGNEFAGDPTVLPLERSDAGAVEAFTTSSDAVRRGSADSRLWKPVVLDDSVIAVLGLLWDDPDVLDDPSILTVCDLLVAEVKVTLDRIRLMARLEAIARTDELTGLPNRRAWQEALPRELQRASRSGERLCVAMLDLDHFKRYNDARGHQAGDLLLKQVAVGWSHELRAADILARYGGEEFAVALPACPLERALDVVERLRAAIPGEGSCSAGVALWDGGESASELLGRADRALYEAKHRGRDRTIVSENDKPSPLGEAGVRAVSGL